MACPRFCASSNSANVESPRMLIRSMGSICTATFRVIVAPKNCCDNASFYPIALAAGVEGRGDMAWNPARRHQDGVETDIADVVISISRQPCFGGGDDAQALAVGDRPSGIVQSFARLHLHEDQQAPASRDDIDFADRAPPAPRHDAKAFGDQKRSRPAFG